MYQILASLHHLMKEIGRYKTENDKNNTVSKTSDIISKKKSLTHKMCVHLVPELVLFMSCVKIKMLLLLFNMIAPCAIWLVTMFFLRVDLFSYKN